MFNTNEINLGSLNENKSYSAFFSYTGEPDNIQLESSCGCTGVSWDRVNHAVKFTLHTGSVPKHLEKAGQYTLVKTIVATISTQHAAPESFVLTIKGTVHK